MNTLINFSWIAFFGAAYYLKKSHRVNLPLILALVGFGIRPLINTLLYFEVVPYEVVRNFDEIMRVIYIASLVLLLLGAFILVSPRSGLLTPGHGANLLDVAGANLSTLFIPRNTTNTYSRAEALRDAACGQLVQLAKTNEIEVIEQKSNAHSPNVWFRVDYLLPKPDPNLSLRAHVEVVVERFDFHRFEHLFSVVAQVGTERKAVAGVVDFDQDTAQRIHTFIMQPGSKLRLPNRVRAMPWQLWRPRNRVSRLKQDWITIGGTALGLVLLAIPVAGWLACIGVFIALYIRNKRRRTYVLTSGRPLSDPRSLRWMDSWQATIVGLGGASAALSDAAMQRLRESAPAELAVGVERIGYWGVDSRVERDQVVIRYRHALGFMHIVSHGENLYVSWECHINGAAWAEETLARGVDKLTGLPVHANRVVSGVKYLNEYDVADSNFLAEWIHEALKRELKLKMVEHQIDQEVDFTVQRESRKQALSDQQGRQQEERRDQIKRVGLGLSRFRRVS